MKGQKWASGARRKGKGKGMEAMQFKSLEDATSFLALTGFSFVGAPNRWKKTTGNEVSYAFVTETDDGATVAIVSIDSKPTVH
jgi:hypothetical protein